MDKEGVIFQSESKEWIQVMDDFYYSLWSIPDLRDKLEDVGKSNDICYFSAGDFDNSYELVLIKGGKIIRKIVIEDPQIDRNKLVKKFDVGARLPSEEIFLENEDKLEGLLKLVIANGIEVNYQGYTTLKAFQLSTEHLNEYQFDDEC
ncbi:hypothetical protein [Flammeovirga agarivorans]|uniref:Uncharacterized protein n=1 Tax=Flammeovirga agarivorans TaxID=2726742 RepID=A0A7X8SRE7_9BACT|nr:hypothetical protein [Flammeovirga agarivorans]NLR95025.1 hypothetical protein [Flammeovirga agarivorans]